MNDSELPKLNVSESEQHRWRTARRTRRPFRERLGQWLAKRRRWFQFRLGALLVLVLLISIAMAWWSYRAQRARKNRERVAAAIGQTASKVEQLGGTYWTTTDRRRPQTRPEKFLQDPGDADDPVGVRMVVAEFDKVRLTDEDFKQLEGLTNIWWLALPGTNVTDAGLAQIAGLENLSALELGNTKITDHGLQQLKGMAKLQVLSLNGTRITGPGLEHLQQLPNLRVLDLSGTAITDAGLSHLRGLTALQTLRLQFNPQLSGEGVHQLRQALPNCKIER